MNHLLMEAIFASAGIAFGAYVAWLLIRDATLPPPW